MARRSILVVLALLVSMALLAGCGSSGSDTPATAPVQACSLLTAKEAASVFQIGTFQLRDSNVSLDQTYCNYPGHYGGTMLITNVSWFKKELTTFTEVHSPFAMKVSGKTPSGANIPAPTFTALTVDGETAYWDDDLPSGSGSAVDIGPNAQMSAEEKGYLVILESRGLTESQNAEALGIMLKRL